MTPRSNGYRSSSHTDSAEIKRRYLLALREKANRRKYNRLHALFPDEGPLRRELYPKHMAFFEASADHREILFLAANRIGKSEAGGYACAVHLTGLYPHWWKGRRFNRPIKAMAAGDTGQTTRDILQFKLIGDYNDIGTGLIPKTNLEVDKFTRKNGIPESFEKLAVRHIDGHLNYIWLRSYEQGRKVFQGFEQDLIWLDEEVPKDVYDEALVRTMTTGGLVMMTYTPIQGMTELTLSFLESAGIVG